MTIILILNFTLWFSHSIQMVPIWENPVALFYRAMYMKKGSQFTQFIAHELKKITEFGIRNVTFHEQHSIGYGFPSLLLVTRASADVSELVFKHEWRSHECLKTIPTHMLRHTWPEVVMGNHTRSSAVHGRSFHKGLTKRSIIFV